MHETYEVLCSGCYCVVWSQRKLKFAFEDKENLTATKEQM